MKLTRTTFFVAAGIFLIGAKAPATEPAPATNTIVTTKPVYVPNTAHANEPLPDGILAWDALSKSTDAAADQKMAHFIFNFTNIANNIDLGLATNVTSITNFTIVTNASFWARLWGEKITRVASIVSNTNIVTVTNSITPIPVTILSVRPSCGCTTAELPPLPWTLASGTNGQISLSVNLQGKSGSLIKTVNVSTDKGSKTLMLHINILPAVIPKMTEAERARDLAVAKIDRQAVFQGDCAKCHLNNIQGKYGKPLFDSICAICHEAEQRAAVVPDLHNLKTPTNVEFWRTWIAHGKPGSLMPAFASSDGGPLTDMQIASITAFLNVEIQSQVPVNQ
jgi:mono/diheme cytochrome c family protein